MEHSNLGANSFCYGGVFSYKLPSIVYLFMFFFFIFVCACFAFSVKYKIHLEFDSQINLIRGLKLTWKQGGKMIHLAV